MTRKFNWKFIAIALAMAVAGLVAAELSPKVARKLDPRLSLLIRIPELQNVALAKSPALIQSPAGNRARVLIKSKGSVAQLEARGARVIARVGDIATAIVPVERLADLASLDDVKYIEAAKVVRLLNDVAVEAAGGVVLHQQRNLTGRGVIVGVLDSGIDWRHPDFRKANGQTRIKFLLDLSEPGDTDGDGDLDGNGPFGGTLYTESQINQALNGNGTVTEVDKNGHGTHVAGTAAGNGLATGANIPPGTYAGMAPEADIIFVKGQRGDSGELLTDEIVNTLQFIDSMATVLGEPCVINFSFGGHQGAHDGTALHEEAIDDLVGSSRPGRVVVVAAGNEGTANIHLGGTMSGPAVPVEFEIPAYTAISGTRNDYVSFEVWYSGSANLSFRLATPSGANYGPVRSGRTFFRDTADGFLLIDNASAGRDERNDDKRALIQVFDNSTNIPKAGDWTLTITGSSGHYDLWLSPSSSSMRATLTTTGDFSKVVNVPGTARNAITVGAWISKKSWTDVDGNGLELLSLVVGAAGDFSSPGPTRDGRLKPEITAPGQMIGSSLSFDAPAGGEFSIWPSTRYVLQDNRHAIGSGTSFAAPVVAGGVALMLQKNPSADAIEIRNALIASATADNFTQTVPNNKWGYGKVDFARAVDILTAIEEQNLPTVTPLSFQLAQNYPNPFSAAVRGNPKTRIGFQVSQPAPVRIAVFDLLGRKVRSLVDGVYSPGLYQVNWDGRDEDGRPVAAGVYLYRMAAGKFTASRKLLVMK